MKKLYLFLSAILVMTLFYMSECEPSEEKGDIDKEAEGDVLDDPGGTVTWSAMDSSTVGTGDIGIIDYMRKEKCTILKFYMDGTTAKYILGRRDEAQAADPSPDVYNDPSLDFTLSGDRILAPGRVYELPRGPVWVELTESNRVLIYQ